MRTEYFLFVNHTTSILAKISTWCFEHSGDISCSLLVNPSHTDESWEGRNTCLWTYIYIYIYIYILETLTDSKSKVKEILQVQSDSLMTQSTNLYLENKFSR